MLQQAAFAQHHGFDFGRSGQYDKHSVLGMGDVAEVFAEAGSLRRQVTAGLVAGVVQDRHAMACAD